MFHPHTEQDRAAMLKAIGARSIEDLFTDVPEKHRFPDLDLPGRLTEMEVVEEIGSIAAGNETARDMVSFLGAGAYHHYIPAAVDSILRRGEFFTAYTPYQPEVSQGTLQAIFEYQSHIVNLTGMDVSNASHYDGATAAAEAVNMARVIHRDKRGKALLSPALHPHYRETINTYIAASGVSIVGEDIDPRSGPDALIPLLDEDTAVVVVGYPDFFGRIFDYSELSAAAHEVGALVAVSINPTTLALLKPPSEFGADIVCGEGQPLGIPLSFGGPYLGILATTNQYVRSIAGRLVGETTDTKGQSGYVLTLSTREQHIRREKAASNICTNQGLMALAATTYISFMGKEGLKEVANLCYQNAHYAAAEISKLKDFDLLFPDTPFFHEFAIKCPKPAAEINQHLLENEILGGFDLGRDYPGLKDGILFAVTEMNSREEIDYLVEVLSEVGNG
jgi:glycine dehydrogenase subunit 1